MSYFTRANLASHDATVEAALLSALDTAKALDAAAPTSAYTQTYSTAAREVTAATAVAVATDAATTGGTDYGYTEAQANAIPVAINALVADVLQLRKLINALIDDLQATGIGQ